MDDEPTQEAACASPEPEPEGPSKPRYDWYQTQANVCIDVLVKKVQREDASVTFTENAVIDPALSEGGVWKVKAGPCRNSHSQNLPSLPRFLCKSSS